MDNINYEDFKNICRMCMLDCDINFNKNSVILDIFLRLTDIHFDINDKLPQQICDSCFEFMNEIHSFSIICKRSHSSLMKCLNNYETNRLYEEQDIIQAIKTEDDITIDEHKIEFVYDELDNDRKTNDVSNEDVNEITNNLSTPVLVDETNEQINIKDELTIEEHKIEFIKDELDYDWETKDVLSKDVTERTNEEDHISEHSSVSKNNTNVQIRRYKCDQCEKSFRQSNDLKRHKRLHSGERPYQCDQCEKSFNQSGALTNHKRVHSGDRPYQCGQCGKSFAVSGNLLRHKRVHSGERPYQCNQCGASFAQSETLIKHERVHSGERPYQCDQCEKLFTASGKLLRHKRVHSGVRPYKCDHCEKTFNRLDNLKYHKRLHNRNVN